MPLKANAFTTAPPTVNNNDVILFSTKSDKQLNQSLQSKVQWLVSHHCAFWQAFLGCAELLSLLGHAEPQGPLFF